MEFIKDFHHSAHSEHEVFVGVLNNWKRPTKMHYSIFVLERRAVLGGNR
jgi:hypothetical protein